MIDLFDLLNPFNELTIDGEEVDDEDNSPDYTQVEDDNDDTPEDDDVTIDDGDNELEDYTTNTELDDINRANGEDVPDDANNPPDENIDPPENNDNQEDYTAADDIPPDEDDTPTEDNPDDAPAEDDVTVDDGEDDNPPQEDNNDTPTDDNAENVDMDAEQDEAIADANNPDEGGTDDAGADMNTPDTGGTDYTQEDMDEDPDNPDGGGNDADNPDGNMDDTDTTDNAEEDNPLKDMEKDLFKDLTPEQISIKNAELLQNYIDLYDTINSIFDNINMIPKTYENTRALEFIAEKLIELKDIVNMIITTTYITRTYVENLTTYKECLLMLKQINTMLKALVQKSPK